MLSLWHLIFTATSSTLQCIFSVVYGSDGSGLTSMQIRALLQYVSTRSIAVLVQTAADTSSNGSTRRTVNRNYIPFCLIPMMLTLDMMMRIVGLLSKDEPVVEAQGKGKAE